jgi:hypothetical protein
MIASVFWDMTPFILAESAKLSEEPAASSPPINVLNTELNPVCHLLALLGAHQIVHVSRISVNSL